MNDAPENIKTQLRTGYILLVGTLVVTAGGTLVLWYYGVPPVVYLGMLIPAAILVLIGYRNISLGKKGIAIHDERRAQIVHEAGNHAFWLFLVIITYDSVLRVVPEEGGRTIYIMLGLTSFGLSYVSIVYLKPWFSNIWKTN